MEANSTCLRYDTSIQTVFRSVLRKMKQNVQFSQPQNENSLPQIKLNKSLARTPLPNNFSITLFQDHRIQLDFNRFRRFTVRFMVTYIFWLRTPWLPGWKSLTIIPICRVVSTNCSIVCPNKSNLSGTLSSAILLKLPCHLGSHSISGLSKLTRRVGVGLRLVRPGGEPLDRKSDGIHLNRSSRQQGLVMYIL